MARTARTHATPAAFALEVAALAVALSLAGALTLAAPPARATTITIVNSDNPNEGFNDNTAAAPVGGNPGTTVGAQRLFVFQTAANIWESLLRSDVEIRVTARFDPQSCSATGGILGSAGPATLHREFGGAIFSGTWYHQALANKLSGSDLSATNNDITATFNSGVGGAACLPAGWYYGIDGNEGGQIELLPVVIHELGHGLGFSTTTNGSTGSELNGFPHVCDRFLMDESLGLHWYQMSNGQRTASAVSCNELVWDGPSVTQQAPGMLSPKPLVRVNAPAGIAGDYDAGQADFGPPLTEGGLTGDVVLANDGVGVTTNACEPLVNVVAGKIVILDRGGCIFTVKVKNAQNAGAIGVIVADSIAGCPPGGLGGSDPTITIPSVRLTKADGDLLKANLAGLNTTLFGDPLQLAGATAAGRVKMFAPNPFISGSSVSHWDVSASPNLLMEPAINNSLSSSVDLTMAFFADIGWLGPASAVLDGTDAGGRFAFSLNQNEPNPGAGLTNVHFSIPQREHVALRVFDVSGRLVSTAVDEVLDAGPHDTRIATAGLSSGVYFYRLEGGGKSLSRRFVVLR